MTDRDYTLPALAAFATAVGMPLLFILDVVSSAGLGNWRDMATGGSGLVSFAFLLLGALMAYSYLALRAWLRDRLNYRKLDFLILALVGVTLAFHLGLFVLWLVGAWFASGEALAVMAVAFWIGFLVLFGILDIAIAIVLVRDREQLPGLLLLFAGVSGLLGMVELSILLSPAALVLIPVLLVVLALCLLHRPDVLEVI